MRFLWILQVATKTSIRITSSTYDPLCDRPQTNYPLQRLPNVEERLLQLEGDKDSLHLQVSAISR